MILEDLVELQNKWVAFSKDRKEIVDEADSLRKLLKQLKNKKNLIISYIQPADRFISP